MNSTERRYDIDWLRVIAIALLLIYHVAIVFQPWGTLVGFITSSESMESIWIPMAMLNVWRIPILFFVSGMGVCFAMKKRTWKQLIAERSWRILLPLVFGMLAIVPIHIMLTQMYYSQDISYFAHRAHLWFLANIFAYVLILLPIFYYLKHKQNGKLRQKLNQLFSSPFTVIIVMSPFVVEAEIMAPEHFEMYSMTWHGFFLGLLAFLFGYLFIYSGDGFWRMVSKWRWLFFVMAFSLYLTRLVVYELMGAPDYLLSIESNLWVFSVFGFGYKYLNRPGKTLQYLSQAAYPIYIIHMVFLYLGCVWILPMDFPVSAKLLLVTLITFIGSYAFYELVIRRVGVVGVLFGLKRK
ncbi:acyltransferase family protein [Carboxylicivirga sp. N1Y90]|uniref:acyltransferase family protein n=1 Tax=Carboxylicivirga fragile TaxID=3417571 RepID=UPI003D340CEA|nr:acyltransferase family protein [Marinilabiliaceae bacterium N1Y90]